MKNAMVPSRTPTNFAPTSKMLHLRSSNLIMLTWLQLWYGRTLTILIYLMKIHQAHLLMMWQHAKSLDQTMSPLVPHAHKFNFQILSTSIVQILCSRIFTSLDFFSQNISKGLWDLELMMRYCLFNYSRLALNQQLIGLLEPIFFESTQSFMANHDMTVS